MSRQPVPEPLGHILSRICRLVHARMYALVGQVGLHRGQPLVLKALWGQDGLTQTELMEKTGLSIYRLRAALNCLRGARLITLDLDKQYMLSENGEKLLELAQAGAIR